MPANFVQNVSFTDPNQSDLAAIQRRMQLGELLQQQGMSPIQSSRPDAPVHFTQGLAKMLQAYKGGQQVKSAEAERKALLDQREQRMGADTAMLAQALQGRPAQPRGLYEDPSGNVTQQDAIPAQTPVQSLGQAIPMMGQEMRGPALNLMAGAQQRQDQQQFQSQQAEEARQGRLSQFQLASDERAAAQQRQQEFLAQQQRMAAADRDALARMNRDAATANRALVKIKGPDGKPQYVTPEQAIGKEAWSERGNNQLPPSALKEQNELLEGIGTAESIKSDLAALDGQIATGQLQLGPVNNAINAARNFTGLSNQESRNYNSYKTTLERLRNDSLRLNKGVQTEGDAQRAWNELMGNVNDPQVVRQRLQEIQAINDRAANLKRSQIELIRSNFGLENLTPERTMANQPPAVGKAPASDRRTAPRNGKTIVVDY